MFENVKAIMRQMEAQKISIPINLDADGYIDRECPDDNCLFEFKVCGEDWKNLFKEESVFCPMCRHEASSQSWFTTAQVNEGREKSRAYIVGQLNNAFRKDAQNFNSKQSHNSFLKLTMDFKGKKGEDYIVPLSSKDEMQLKIQCKECNARYAVIGSAFFCPCCGHNSAEETFDNSVKKIEVKISSLNTIRKSLLENIGKDEAEIACRSMIESGLNDCVVALQRFCEVTFAAKAPEIRVRFNAFQNIEAGSEYWERAIGEGYSDWISQDELRLLKVFFQRRHLLSHREGMVDQKYIDNSGDLSYSVGQRIVVKPDDVNMCLGIILKLVNSLKIKIETHE